MNLQQWVGRLLGRARPQAPPSLEASGDTEAQRRIAIALRRTQNETAALRSDGQLAERIRRNALAGRDALEGKP